FCGGNHWDRDCTYYRPKATAYHLYQVDTTEEEYGDAEDIYESLQSEVFNNMNDDYKPEEENSDPEDDDKDQGTTATYQTTYTPSISQSDNLYSFHLTKVNFAKGESYDAEK